MQDSVGFLAHNISFNHHIIAGKPVLANTIQTRENNWFLRLSIEVMEMCFGE